MALNKKSILRLEGVHPDLVKVVLLASDRADFVVTEGVRTLLRQSELVKAGASQTMKSRHLTGHAVDLAALVGGEVRWDWPLYTNLGNVVKSAAAELSIPLEWGGDWKSFKDGPHFQLPWKEYPSE